MKIDQNSLQKIKTEKKRFNREIGLRKSDYLFVLSKRLNLTLDQVLEVWDELEV